MGQAGIGNNRNVTGLFTARRASTLKNIPNFFFLLLITVTADKNALIRLGIRQKRSQGSKEPKMTKLCPTSHIRQKIPKRSTGDEWKKCLGSARTNSIEICET